MTGLLCIEDVQKEINLTSDTMYNKRQVASSRLLLSSTRGLLTLLPTATAFFFRKRRPIVVAIM